MMRIRWLIFVIVLVAGCGRQEQEQVSFANAVPSAVPTMTELAQTAVGQIAVPITSNGVEFAVIEFSDLTLNKPGQKRLNIRFFVHNIDHQELAITSDSFTYTDASGKTFANGFINGGDDSDTVRIPKGEQATGSANFLVDSLDQLIVMFTPYTNAPPIHVKLSANLSDPNSPFAALDLSDVLFQEGDIPESEKAGSGLSDMPPIFTARGLAKPTYFRAQPFFILNSGSTTPGITSIYVYDNFDDRDGIYSLYLYSELLGNEQELLAIGEKAFVSENLTSQTNIRQLVFTRCHATITIFTSASNDSDLPDVATLVTYAQRLDARLEPLVCTKS